jgi:hypothetical protein
MTKHPTPTTATVELAAITDDIETTHGALAGLIGVHPRTISRALIGGDVDAQPSPNTKIMLRDACSKLRWPYAIIRDCLTGADRLLNVERASRATATSESGLMILLTRGEACPAVLTLRDGRSFWSLNQIAAWNRGWRPWHDTPPAAPAARQPGSLPIDADAVQQSGDQIVRV